MPTIDRNTPYYSISSYLKSHFGGKVIKLSLDGGFTCPNRDGSKGVGGCAFCSDSGSGEFAGDIPGQIELLSKKWNAQKYIAYFQNHTNTYAPVSRLREKFLPVLQFPGVCGLAIATRPDCLSDDVLAFLSEINKQTFLWVELGLQTAFDETASRMNRCYRLEEFDYAMKRLSAYGIKTVVHLIMGLPGETKQQMLHSVQYTCDAEPFGIKLHMLNVVRNAPLAKLYPGYVPFQSIEEYIQLVADALELIPPEITIHRLTADAPRQMLIAPEWSYRKRTILNGIQKEMRIRGSYQGIYSRSLPGPRRPSL